MLGNNKKGLNLWHVPPGQNTLGSLCHLCTLLLLVSLSCPVLCPRHPSYTHTPHRFVGTFSLGALRHFQRTPRKDSHCLWNILRKVKNHLLWANCSNSEPYLSFVVRTCPRSSWRMGLFCFTFVWHFSSICPFMRSSIKVWSSDDWWMVLISFGREPRPLLLGERFVLMFPLERLAGHPQSPGTKRATWKSQNFTAKFRTGVKHPDSDFSSSLVYLFRAC